jgi:hypothetical protein
VLGVPANTGTSDGDGANAEGKRVVTFADDSSAGSDVGQKGAAASAASLEHRSQLRAQLLAIHAVVLPRHKPCDANLAHSVLRSAHSVTIAAAGAAVCVRSAGAAVAIALAEFTPEHGTLQLRAQFCETHTIFPRHMPCDTHDAHDGFRSTHAEPTGGCWPTKIGAGEAGTNTGDWTETGAAGTAWPKQAALQLRAQKTLKYALDGPSHKPF